MAPHTPPPHIPTPEMHQQPAEVFPLLVPGPGQPNPPTQEITAATPTAEPAIVPPTSTLPPEEGWVRRFISRYPTLLGLGFLLLVGACFGAPIASNSYGHFVVDGCPHNESGVGFWV